MNKQPFMIVIAGSTGVGKTDLALSFGKNLPIEIVNADLGQFYQPLTIGTAKPAWQQESIKHHLFDIFTTPQTFTSLHYKTVLMETLNDIWKRNKIPVIVGGSTFYIESIFFEIAEPEKIYDPVNKPKIDNLLNVDVWNQLNIIDSERAAAIHPKDYYRINRALDIWRTTGIKPSTLKPHYNPPARYWFFHLTRDRAELYARINERVNQMIDTGWIDEVRALINTEWQPFIESKKFIGYSEIIEFLETNSIARQMVVNDIAQKTRNYAKRQETYWKRLKKKLSDCLVEPTEYTNKQVSKLFTLDLTKANLHVVSKQLSEQLLKEIESSNL